MGLDFPHQPACLISLVLVSLFVPETRHHQMCKHTDLIGILTLSATIFCLVLALIEGNDWNWVSPSILLLLECLPPKRGMPTMPGF